MTPSERELVRAQVAAERERTSAQIEALSRDFDEIVGSYADDPPDDEHDPEGTTIAWEREQIGALLARARATLVDIDVVLDRIDHDGYGICEDCGDPIAAERLDALPAVRTCVRCAARR